MVGVKEPGITAPAVIPTVRWSLGPSLPLGPHEPYPTRPVDGLAGSG